MSFEAIKEIAFTEESAEKLKLEASSVARRYALEKKKETKLLREQLLKEAEDENSRLMKETVHAAEEKLSSEEKAAAENLNTFILKSRSKMQRAEDAVFERIVNG